MVNLNWQPGMTLDTIEKDAVLQAFRFYRGNKTATANAIGRSVRWLDGKLEEYQMTDKQEIERKKNERESRHEFDLRQRGFHPSQQPPPPVKDVPEADAGVDGEPASQASPQFAVSVPVGAEVQDMPPTPAPRARHDRGSGGVRKSDGGSQPHIHNKGK